MAMSQLSVEFLQFPITVRPESFDTLRYSGPTETPATRRIEGLRMTSGRVKAHYSLLQHS